MDIVYELMLRQRDVALSETLEQLSDIGSRTYLYASSYLVCLETEITEELVSKLAELDPLPIKFIFRDSAFKDDIALKDETFRRLKALIEKNAGIINSLCSRIYLRGNGNGKRITFQFEDDADYQMQAIVLL